MTTSSPSPEPPKRSKRMLACWGCAFAALLLGGFFCLTVVAPAVREHTDWNEERALVAEYAGGVLSEEEVVARLGGPKLAAERLARHFNDMTDPHRAQIPVILVACGDDGVPALKNAVAGSSGLIRSNAVVSLAKVGAGRADTVPALTKALADPDGTVRGNAAQALAQLGPKAQSAVPALTKLLTDTSKVARANAAYALASIGTGAKQAVPALITAMGDGSWEVRGNVAVALRQIAPRDPRVTAAFIRHAQDKHWRVRAAVAVGLGASNSRQAIPTLETLAKDQDPRVAKCAAGYLKKIKAAQEKK